MTISKDRMKIMLGVLLGLALLAISNMSVSSEPTPQKSEAEFAQAALDKYISNFITEENFRNFGFDSLEEALAAEVGEPYSVTMITLKDLQTYEQGSGVESLLIGLDMSWYPVISSGEIRTKLEILKQDGRFIAGEFGGTREVWNLADVMERLPSILKEIEVFFEGEPIILHIPALQAEFLLIDSGKVKYLVPAMINPGRYELENGELYEAEELIILLQDFAQEIEADIVY